MPVCPCRRAFRPSGVSVKSLKGLRRSFSSFSSRNLVLRFGRLPNIGLRTLGRIFEFVFKRWILLHRAFIFAGLQVLQILSHETQFPVNEARRRPACADETSKCNLNASPTLSTGLLQLKILCRSALRKRPPKWPPAVKMLQAEANRQSAAFEGCPEAPNRCKARQRALFSSALFPRCI